MKFTYQVMSGLLCSVLATPLSAYAESCTVSGATRSEAAKQYANSCELRLKDCDPVAGKWYCSSHTINANSDLLLNQSSAAELDTVNPDSSDQWSVASQSCVDNDGDGWGWDGISSCQVNGNGGANTTKVVTRLITGICVDPDGDGWGWDGSGSCQVSSVTGHESRTLFDSPAGLNTVNDTQCPGAYSPADITDLVLVTGQSNVTGADTTVAGRLDRWGKVNEFHAPDRPHPRVFAWTVNPRSNNAGAGWKVAALNQSWHDSAPGVGGIARNNFAFHFAKSLAQNHDCRVVGFIMVSEGGKGISHWDNHAPGWNEVVRHVTEAMEAIGRSSIDAILWHQGESDWITDGTCYTDDGCQNGQPDYYPQKLYSRIANDSIPNPVGRSALIDRLRRESWYGDDKPFIAGETIKAPVNVHLNKLNTDNDPWTACVDSDSQSGLGVRANDPFKNHYNAAGLRELGKRYAAEYLRMVER